MKIFLPGNDACWLLEHISEHLLMCDPTSAQGGVPSVS